MVTAIARGEGGIVMSFALSRLSRNDLDWHHLVYLCRWCDTLIADEQGLYDPSSSGDRMMLGIRGQVSGCSPSAVSVPGTTRWMSCS
jgi:DNA invertase Pin-like site-specific DNA recombinase